MHWEFSKSKFVSFGTRRDSFPFTEEGFAEFAKAHPGLEDAPKDFDIPSDFLFEYHSGISSVTLFTEYVGPNSFAGQHKSDDVKQHIIIDVMKNHKLLSPDKFLDMFQSQWAIDRGWSKLNYAKVIYQGKYSGQLVEDIRNGKYKINEGAVIKGTFKDEIYMVKVKTNKYFEKLKEVYQDTWEDYWE
jgi:hypothetical protein